MPKWVRKILRNLGYEVGGEATYDAAESWGWPIVQRIARWTKLAVAPILVSLWVLVQEDARANPVSFWASAFALFGSTLALFVPVLVLIHYGLKRRTGTERQPADTLEVPSAPALVGGEGFISDGWLERDLIEADFDEPASRKGAAAFANHLRMWGIFTREAAHRFLNDMRCRDELTAIYREELNEPDRVLDPSGYCWWGPRLFLARPEDRQLVLQQLRTEIRGFRDPETGREILPAAYAQRMTRLHQERLAIATGAATSPPELQPTTDRKLSEAARQLMGARNPKGTFSVVDWGTPPTVCIEQTSRAFKSEHDHSLRTRYVEAVNELLAAGFLTQHERTNFHFTSAGFELYRELQSAPMPPDVKLSVEDENHPQAVVLVRNFGGAASVSARVKVIDAPRIKPNDAYADYAVRWMRNDERFSVHLDAGIRERLLLAACRPNETEDRELRSYYQMRLIGSPGPYQWLWNPRVPDIPLSVTLEVELSVNPPAPTRRWARFRVTAKETLLSTSLIETED